MMLLHIDKETKIPVCDIVGIFDLDSATVSSISKRFLKQQQEAGTLYTTNLSLPRSFVVCAETSGQKMKQTVAPKENKEAIQKTKASKQTKQKRKKEQQNKKSAVYFSANSPQMLCQKIQMQSERYVVKETQRQLFKQTGEDGKRFSDMEKQH